MTIEETIAAAVESKVRAVVREEIRALLSELQREAPQAPKAEPLLTVEDVAERCGKVTPETVRAWIHAKKLAAQKAGSRYLVKLADLDLFLANEAAVENPAPIDSDAHLRLVLGRVSRLGSK